MNEVVVNIAFLVAYRLDLLVVLVDIELGDAANRDFEESLDVLVRDIAAELLAERLETLLHRRENSLHRLLLLDTLVDALFHKNAVERARVEKVV